MNSLNKKGFTLIELMAVIVILGIIMLAGGISIFNIIASQQKSLLEEQLKNLADTAITYGISKNYILESCGAENDVDPSALSNSNCFKRVTVKNLIDVNFFENKNDLCEVAGVITLYKVETSKNTFETKAYIPNGICYY